MQECIKHIFRRTKRAFLYEGYSQPVHKFIQRVEAESTADIPKEGEYVVNLSFDHELALTTYFWQYDFNTTLRIGQAAYNNFEPTISYLTREGIAFNIQIVGMLLDPEMQHSALFTKEMRACIQKNHSLFQLLPEHAHLLLTKCAEIGMHSYSHRVFSNLSTSEVEAEIVHSVDSFRAYQDGLLPLPTFMSFPRNESAGVEILTKYGIRAWRSGSVFPERGGIIPRGLLFSPAIMSVDDLRRLLERIRQAHPGFYLHFWNHLTEMDVETLKRMVNVIRESGWQCSNVRDFMNIYE